MVVVPLVRQHVEEQRRMADAAQRRRGENGAVKTVSDPITHHTSGRSVPFLGTVHQLVQILLDPGWSVEPREYPKLSLSKYLHQCPHLWGHKSHSKNGVQQSPFIGVP